MENKKITASTKVDRKFLDLLKTFDLFQETPHKNEVILNQKFNKKILCISKKVCSCFKWYQFKNL